MRAVVDQSVGRTRESRFLGAMPKEWREIVATLSPLWVGGAALLCLLPAILLQPVLARVLDRADAWAMYLLAGTLFPLVLAAILLLERVGKRLPVPLGIVLAVLPIVASALGAGLRHSLIALGLAVVQTAICALVIKVTDGEIRPSRLVAFVTMGFVAWTVAIAMVAWPELEPVVNLSFRVIAVGVVALAACCWWAYGKAGDLIGWRRRAQHLADGAGIIIITLLAFRTDGLFLSERLGGFNPFAHWAAFVGPAEAVRNGGWLLWDTPTSYGLLSTLLIAAVPVSSTWQSLYLLNALTTALIAIAVFFGIRCAWKSIAGSVFAVALTVPVVFLVSTWPPLLVPEHHYPSSGAFRFGWTYALIAVLLLERRFAPGSTAQKVVLLAGCLSWVVGVLWSAESAVYTTAIWLPAYGLIVLRDHGGFDARRNWRQMLAWLAVPLLMLAAAMGLMFAIYRVALGRGPDLLAYFDVALSFSGSFVLNLVGFVGGTGPNQTVVVVFFGFLLFALAIAAIGFTPVGLQDLPILVGLAFGLWAQSSYPVGLPAPGNIFRLMPFVVFGLGILVGIIAPRYAARRDHTWIDLVKTGTVPLLTGLLVICYANVAQLQAHVESIQSEGFIRGDVTNGLPQLDPALVTLLHDAGVQRTDPIFYAGLSRFGGITWGIMEVWTPAGETKPVVANRPWLSATMMGLGVVPDERKQTYLARSTVRDTEGGWLIEPRNAAIRDLDFALTPGPWFFDQLAITHTPTKIAENREWRLVWYEPIDSTPSHAPAGRDGRVPPLPTNLVVNDLRMARSVLPSVWGYFGPEWSPQDDKALCSPGSGTLLLYAPSPLEGRLTLIPFEGEFAGPVQVGMNDGVMAGTRVAPNGNVQANVALLEGWNTVTVQLDGHEAPEPSQRELDGCANEDPNGSALVIDRVNLQAE